MSWSRTLAQRPDGSFIVLALVLAAPGGTLLGLSNLAAGRGWAVPAGVLQAFPLHGQLQVYGFLGLFTMGVALLMWPKVLATRLVGQELADLSLATMLVGIALAPSWVVTSAVCKTLAASLFVLVLWLTRRASSARSPLSREQSLYLICGTLWLLLSPGLGLRSSLLGLKTALWGFLGLYVAGIGLRLHPGMLGLKGVRQAWLRPSLAFWNTGVATIWVGPGWLSALLLGLGAGMFLMALGPFRRSRIPPAGMPWLRVFVRLSYFWLLVAVLLNMAEALGFEGLSSAARHAFATGFLLTMVTGMGLRMLPAFESRRLRWKSGPWIVLLWVTLGAALRVAGLMAGETRVQLFGAGLQSLGILGFALSLLSAPRIVPCLAPREASGSATRR